MRRTDVQTHRAGHYGPRYPAVCVKDYRGPDAIAQAIRDADAAAWDYPPDMAEWIAARVPETDQEEWYQLAQQDGWDQLQEEAAHIFGPRVTVSAAGRSGGWAIVQGLPDVDVWDAVQLAKWGKWRRVAAAIVADTPCRYASLIHHNMREPAEDTARAARAERDHFIVAAMAAYTGA